MYISLYIYIVYVYLYICIYVYAIDICKEKKKRKGSWYVHEALFFFSSSLRQPFTLCISFFFFFNTKKIGISPYWVKEVRRRYSFSRIRDNLVTRKGSVTGKGAERSGSLFAATAATAT